MNVAPDIAAKTARSLAGLKHKYHLGRKTASQLAKHGGARLADKNRVNISTLWKAQAFARRYTEAEFQELCALRRPDGLSLTWGHVVYLLTVPCDNANQRRSRAALQREAAREGWTVPELYQEIKRRYPKYRRRSADGIHGIGGRPRRTSGTTLSLVREVTPLLKMLEAQLSANESGNRRTKEIRGLARSAEWREFVELLKFVQKTTTKVCSAAREVRR